jgi:hypothetical protein
MQIEIPDLNTQTFREALEALNRSKVPFAIGGAFAMYHYTDVWRNTNDLDVYIEHRFLPVAVNYLSESGFADYGEMARGDRNWIYHATRNETIVDLIWEPPNHLQQIDATYFERASEGHFLGVPVKFLAPDDLVWSKLFTLNRHRCDWPDIFYVVRACPKGMDWRRIISKTGDHWPVLLSFIVLFDWAYPAYSRCIPADIRAELLKRKEVSVENTDVTTREELLDPWIYTRPRSEQ